MPIQLKKSYNKSENSDMCEAFNRVLIGILTDICLFVTFSEGKGMISWDNKKFKRRSETYAQNSGAFMHLIPYSLFLYRRIMC